MSTIGMTEAPHRSSTRVEVAMAIAWALAIVGLGSGCAGTAGDVAGPPAASAEGTSSSADAESPEPTAGAGQIDNADTVISVREQVDDGGDIIEILELTYDAEHPSLAATEGHNPEIDAINDDIESTVYGAIGTISGSDSWADVRAYPFTSEDYLQIVTTAIAYPTYGTEGELFSWVFDRHTNTWIRPEGVFAEAGLTPDALTEAVSAAFVPDSPAESVERVEPSGFRYVQGVDGWIPEFLIKVTVANTEAEPWDGLFSYQGADATGQPLTKLNAECLFDPAEMDTMDPPLMYARDGAEGAGGLWIELPTYAEVTQIGGGIDADGNRWAEYADDAGAVSVSIRRASAVAATDPSEIRSNVTGAVDAVDAATWRLEASPEVSEAYTYPASVFEFDTGLNEDRRGHLGLYFQTDAGGFVVDFSIPVDLWDKGHALAEDWMKYLSFIDV
ncbi:MAG: hypothetical protein LBK59_02260 [Bifidobacteriaceae bacterium]|nr:hypothetical protein [Bifidobacteriaceae bacterium]